MCVMWQSVLKSDISGVVGVLGLCLSAKRVSGAGPEQLELNGAVFVGLAAVM